MVTESVNKDVLPCTEEKSMKTYMCKRYGRWSTDESWTRTSSTMATNWNRNPIKELRMQDSHRKVWKVELLT